MYVLLFRPRLADGIGWRKKKKDREKSDKKNEAAEGVIGGPNAWDGYLAAITADALVRAQTSGKVETITPAKEKPAFYA